MSVLGEYLHTGAFITAVANNELAGRTHHGYLARVPQLTFLFAGRTEVELVSSGFVENLIKRRTDKICSLVS